MLHLFHPDCASMQTSWFVWGILLLSGYGAGSIPFGLILTKLGGFGDIRQMGSGNIGATNVLRTGRKGLALMTLVLDVAKGCFSVLILPFLLPCPLAPLFAGMGAILGHVFPLWLKFRGGKGVATALGVFMVIDPISGVLALCVWLIMAFWLKYSSLAALVSFAFLPAIMFFNGHMENALFAFFVMVIILYTHRHNIQRLIQGKESQIGQRSLSKKDKDE